MTPGTSAVDRGDGRAGAFLPRVVLGRYWLFGAQASRNADKFKGFAEECMLNMAEQIEL